ncbi:hypothetical protein F5Y18DRAFT_421485 [Xylariaceae sp. FL1019]|nr:hypothetical protein F5Y18DRAFT_421485 [Xylariaceae sp. FL1019]
MSTAVSNVAGTLTRSTSGAFSTCQDGDFETSSEPSPPDKRPTSTPSKPSVTLRSTESSVDDDLDLHADEITDATPPTFPPLRLGPVNSHFGDPMPPVTMPSVTSSLKSSQGSLSSPVTSIPHPSSPDSAVPHELRIHVTWHGRLTPQEMVALDALAPQAMTDGWMVEV